MWISISLPLLACLNTVVSRDVGKTLSMKTLPYVTNSLVNLGKMDISIHLNAHPEDLISRSRPKSHGSNSLFSSKYESPVEEPCPCSSVTYLKDSSQNHPTALLNRILSGNDMFSFKEPASSILCCDSHEQVREDILLEFTPKQTQMVVKPQSSNSIQFPFKFLLDSAFKTKPTLPTVSPKPKAVEILFFPKKRGISPTDFEKHMAKKTATNKNRILPMDFEKLTAKKENTKKNAIQIVGDKEVRNDFKTMKLAPPLASSVKKDLAVQEKIKLETKKVEVTTDKNLNTVV